MAERAIRVSCQEYPSLVRTIVMLAELGILATLSGCSFHLYESPALIQGAMQNTPAESISHLAGQNERALEYYHRFEWPLNVQEGERPRLGVSLSGGGMRSAIFSLGVLTGLCELELFPHETDLLSTVSGGGYIGAWFYAQLVMDEGLSPTDLLDPHGERQTSLGHRTQMIRIPGDPGSLPALVATVFPGIPLNTILNGIPWGLRANVTPVANYYESRFRKSFLMPNDEASGPGSVSWAEVRELVANRANASDPAKRVPNLIMNATVDLGLGNSEAEKSGYNTIYEFTPQRFGSDGMGYYCLKTGDSSASTCPRGKRDKESPSHREESDSTSSFFPSREEFASLSNVAVVSGAALDSSFLDPAAPGPGARLVFSALNLDLGRWYANPDASKKGCGWKYVPFAHLFRPHWYRKGREGCRMLLTDGGHSENLGAYSAIRRLPRVVIIVDGEEDNPRPKKGGESRVDCKDGSLLCQEFTAYRHLRAILFNDFNVVLSIPGIDEGRWPEGPIYLGSVGTVPLGSNPEARVSISVVYVKLPRPEFIREMCGEERSSIYPDSICNYAKKYKIFPQDPTKKDQSFDWGQFRAYRDLGREIVLRGRCEIQNGLGQAGLDKNNTGPFETCEKEDGVASTGISSDRVKEPALVAN